MYASRLERTPQYSQFLPFGSNLLLQDMPCIQLHLHLEFLSFTRRPTCKHCPCAPHEASKVSKYEFYEETPSPHP